MNVSTNRLAGKLGLTTLVYSSDAKSRLVITAFIYVGDHQGDLKVTLQHQEEYDQNALNELLTYAKKMETEYPTKDIMAFLERFFQDDAPIHIHNLIQIDDEGNDEWQHFEELMPHEAIGIIKELLEQV